jgi:hypothetical protein
VIDQEHFDELARGLATSRLSRAQVLKSLAAGMSLGVTGAFGLGQARAATAAPPILRDSQTFNSCEELATYVDTTGVTDLADPKKKTEPGWVGVTHWECSTVPNPKHTTAVTTNNKRRYCLALTSLTTKFSLPTTVTVLEWKPPKNQTPDCKRPPKCKAMWNAIVRKAEKHEMHHVRDTAKIEAGYPPVKESWTAKNSPYQACGTGANRKNEAITKLQTKINKHIEALKDKHCLILDKKVESARDNFHKSPAGKPAQIHCEKCPPQTQCPPEESGTGGSGCDPPCPPGKTCCNGAGGRFECVDLQTDGSHCGRCGNICWDRGRECVNGSCVCVPGPNGTKECPNACCSSRHYCCRIDNGECRFLSLWMCPEELPECDPATCP